MINYKIICRDCLSLHKYKLPRRSNTLRIYCESCAKRRKKECIRFSNEKRVDGRGRPPNPVAKVYGNADMQFRYDETLELGGLL
jgi:hypothetical protein